MAEYEVWDLWYPEAGSQGLAFARGRLNPTDVLLVHAAPQTLRVEVRDQDGRIVASGAKLERSADRPMARLRKDGARLTREDAWPNEQDLGHPVILPGGEVGVLRSWWNDPNGQEWRWQVEFYNHR